MKKENGLKLDILSLLKYIRSDPDRLLERIKADVPFGHSLEMFMQYAVERKERRYKINY